MEFEVENQCYLKNINEFIRYETMKVRMGILQIQKN